MTNQSYYASLDHALREAGCAQPVLVIDKDRLDANIDIVKSKLDSGMPIRIVDKSLPILPLIAHLMARLGTRRVMSFHLPITHAVLAAFPEVEVLFGKPMPAPALRYFLQAHTPEERQDFCRRVVLLGDSAARLSAYAEVAREFDLAFRFAAEIDVGMHRGGFVAPSALAEALRTIAGNSRMECQGLMGYEAHLPKIPGFAGGSKGERTKVSARFAAFLDVLPLDCRVILNTAGSNTALGYGRDTLANEFSMGSGFLAPTDFEGGELAALSPAVFIATPALKIVEAKLPGPEFLTRLMKRLGKLPARGCFTYGGKWMAKPAYPPDLSENALWGTSSNQQFFSLAKDSTLKEDDFVFLRPTQSEAVLQYFGAVLVYQGGRIVDRWQPLPTG
jgi:D-serine deaminase-like pyridoxal phosphate-dependent protein